MVKAEYGTVCVQRAGKQSDRSYKEFAQFSLKPDCYLKDLVKDDVPDELEWEWSDDSFWDALGCFTAAGWNWKLQVPLPRQSYSFCFFQLLLFFSYCNKLKTYLIKMCHCGCFSLPFCVHRCYSMLCHALAVLARISLLHFTGPVSCINFSELHPLEINVFLFSMG